MYIAGRDTLFYNRLEAAGFSGFNLNGTDLYAFGDDMDELFNEDYELFPLEELFGQKTDFVKLLVLTSKDKTFGARYILNVRALTRASELLGGDFYILPCSIHELIFMSFGIDIDADELKEMVKAVNENTVNSEDILSYNVYKWDSNNNVLEMI